MLGKKFVVRTEEELSEGLWFEIPNSGGVRLRISQILPKELISGEKKYTYTVSGKSGKEKMVNSEKQAEYVFDTLASHITGWEGVVGENGEIECNNENKHRFIQQYGRITVDEVIEYDEEKEKEVKTKLTLSGWIQEIATSPENYMNNDTKN